MRPIILTALECFCWLAFRGLVLILLAAGIIALRVLLAVLWDRVTYF